jgi:hypothetical protein
MKRTESAKFASSANRRTLVGVLSVAAAMVVLGLHLLPSSARADADHPVPCVKFWGEARYVVGYDHLVHIVNGCDKRATCTVHTDVNVQPQSVEVAPAAHAIVTTWLGSPTARFTPYVDCKLEGS